MAHGLGVSSRAKACKVPLVAHTSLFAYYYFFLHSTFSGDCHVRSHADWVCMHVAALCSSKSPPTAIAGAVLRAWRDQRLAQLFFCPLARNSHPVRPHATHCDTCDPRVDELQPIAKTRQSPCLAHRPLQLLQHRLQTIGAAPARQSFANKNGSDLLASSSKSASLCRLSRTE